MPRWRNAASDAAAFPSSPFYHRLRVLALATRVNGCRLARWRRRDMAARRLAAALLLRLSLPYLVPFCSTSCLAFLPGILEPSTSYHSLTAKAFGPLSGRVYACLLHCYYGLFLAYILSHLPLHEPTNTSCSLAIQHYRTYAPLGLLPTTSLGHSSVSHV